MDPNATLENLRDLAARVIVGDDDAAPDLADRFQALDDWITRGGFLPAPWRHD